MNIGAYWKLNDFFSSVDGTTNVTIQYSSDYGHLKEGQDYIRISCNADCNPECSYQYYKDNKFVNDPDRRLLVDRKMSGRYICSAKNSFMNAYKDSTNFVDINIKCTFKNKYVLLG